MRWIVAALLSIVFAVADARSPSAVVQREIGSLFATLEQSGCEFNRNGSWYDAKRASEHLHRKYAYLLRRDMVTTTESFIEQAASKSSFSGKSYLVRCAGTSTMESRSWFMQKLLRLRAAADKG